MQGLPRESDSIVFRAEDRSDGDRSAAAVEPIAEDRAAGVSEVDADLMGPSGFGKNIQLSETRPTAADFETRDGGSAGGMARADGHFLALIRMRSDRLLDAIAIAIGRGADQRDVLFAHRAAGELAGELQVARVVFGDEDQAAGVAIESVDDPGPLGAADAAELLKTEGEGGGERPDQWPLAG